MSEDLDGAPPEDPVTRRLDEPAEDADDALVVHGRHDLSPEATSARTGCLTFREDVGTALATSGSGRGLTVDGSAQDVATTAEVGSSTSVPVLGERGSTAADAVEAL